MDKKFSLKFLYADDYEPVFVNGAIGEVGDTGEVVIHFFNERTPLPNMIEFDMDNTDDLSEAKMRPRDLATSKLRVVKAGVIMNLAQVKDLRDLLSGLIDNDTEAS